MISLLVAYTKDNRVIGAQGKIPWNLSSERNRFKQICRDKYVIMGRKSFEEIGKPLPYCKLVVVTRNDKGALSLACPEPVEGKGLIICTSLEEAISFCKSQKQDEILIAGGGSIYEQALPYATKIYATEIDVHFEGDVFFPKLGPEWHSSVKESHEENGISYKYLTYTKGSI